MSKTLLCILSYAKANDAVARHWPYYELAGCDILGVGREDTHCEWPHPRGTHRFVGSVNVGKDSYVKGDNLCRRMIDVLRIFTEERQFWDYTHVCLTEHDAIFTRALVQHPGGLVATLAGYGDDNRGFVGTRYFHGPWWVDRETADEMVDYGERMLKLGLIEFGFPDRFVGLMLDLYDIRFTPAMSYSRNTIDNPTYLAEARQAIKDGAWYVHGIKTEAQLKAVTEGLITP